MKLAAILLALLPWTAPSTSETHTVDLDLPWLTGGETYFIALPLADPDVTGVRFEVDYQVQGWFGRENMGSESVVAPDASQRTLGWFRLPWASEYHVFAFNHGANMCPYPILAAHDGAWDWQGPSGQWEEWSAPLLGDHYTSGQDVPFYSWAVPKTYWTHPSTHLAPRGAEVHGFTEGRAQVLVVFQPELWVEHWFGECEDIALEAGHQVKVSAVRVVYEYGGQS